MTRHLSPDELVTCLEGALDPLRDAHLQQCETCRSRMRDLARIVEQVGPAGDVPEPSPLFWEHFSRRVQTATTTPVGPLWSRSAWMTARVLVVSVAALVLVVALFRFDFASHRSIDVPGAAARRSVDVEPSWEAVSDMAATLSADDVRLVVGVSPDSTFQDLTPSEREAFVRLLGADVARGQ